MGEDAFFRKLESVDRLLAEARGKKLQLAPANDGVRIGDAIPSPAAAALAPVLKVLNHEARFVPMGELSRLVPDIDVQTLVRDLLAARDQGLVAILDDNEVGVSITDAGRKLVAS